MIVECTRHTKVLGRASVRLLGELDSELVAVNKQTPRRYPPLRRRLSTSSRLLCFSIHSNELKKLLGPLAISFSNAYNPPPSHSPFFLYSQALATAALTPSVKSLLSFQRMPMGSPTCRTFGARTS